MVLEGVQLPLPPHIQPFKLQPQNYEQPNLNPNGNTLSGYVGHDKFFLRLPFDGDTDVCFKVY